MDEFKPYNNTSAEAETIIAVIDTVVKTGNGNALQSLLEDSEFKNTISPKVIEPKDAQEILTAAVHRLDVNALQSLIQNPEFKETMRTLQDAAQHNPVTKVTKVLKPQ